MNDLQYLLSDFPNNKFDIGRLSQDIQDSDITIALASIAPGSDVTITFKAGLSVENKALLDAVVANHSGEPLSDNPVHFLEDMPQGGKRVADRGFSFIATAGQSTDFELDITEDIFVKDGYALAKNYEFMDKLTMSIVHPEYGVVIHTYIQDSPFHPTYNDLIGKAEATNKAITETNFNGLKIRFTYVSTGGVDVEVNGIMRAYM